MPYDPAKHHRRSIRLKNYDYSEAGAYFVTICVQDRRSLLGTIRNGVMIPNAAGRMVQKVWDDLPNHYSGIDLDAFTLMPNHIHGIIVLNPAFVNGESMTLGDVVHRFKSFTTSQYTKGVEQLDWTRFERRFWQRNYYEVIIPNESVLQRIRYYIKNNPRMWRCDCFHPNRPSPDSLCPDRVP